MKRMVRCLLVTSLLVSGVLPGYSAHATAEAPVGHAKITKPETIVAPSTPAADTPQTTPPATTAPPADIIVTPQPPELDDAPVLITGYQLDAQQLTFVQLYNDSSDTIQLDAWNLSYMVASKTEEQLVSIGLSGYLLPDSYAVFAAAGSVNGSDSYYQLPALDLTHAPFSLTLHPPAGFAPATIQLADSINGQRYDLSQSRAGNYTSTSAFEPVTSQTSLYGGGLYEPAASPPLRVVELMANARDCGPLDTALDCSEFIKLYNASLEPVDLADYRLRFGNGNDNSGIANTVHLTGTLAADSYVVVQQRDDGEPLSITASGGHVWLEDMHGLRTYAPTVMQYDDIGDHDYKGQAWGFDGEAWRWATPTVGANDFSLPPVVTAQASGLKPCDDDQYRNPETNRCRLIASRTSSLKPCDADEYRHPDTNRCRNLVSTTDALVPCDADEYRSPETNRCRNIASSANTLKPCRADQYRSKETNRCRNIVATTVPEAAFAVEPLVESGKAFVGWWTLGGVGALALGYAGWEWRREAMGAMRKLGTFFHSSK